MTSLWTKNGNLILNDAGSAILCATCPCETTICNQCPGGMATCWELVVSNLVLSCLVGGVSTSQYGWNGVFTLTTVPDGVGNCRMRMDPTRFRAVVGETLGGGGLLVCQFSNSCHWRVDFIGTSSVKLRGYDGGSIIHEYTMNYADFKCNGSNTFAYASSTVSSLMVSHPATLTIEPTLCPTSSGA